MSGRIDYKITMNPQCIPWISAPLPPVNLTGVYLKIINNIAASGTSFEDKNTLLPGFGKG